jgi:hypothetical protein
MSAMPTVALVDQELPVAKLTTEQNSKVATKK